MVRFRLRKINQEDMRMPNDPKPNDGTTELELRVPETDSNSAVEQEAKRVLQAHFAAKQHKAGTKLKKILLQPKTK